MSNYLAKAYPRIGTRLKTLSLGALPTPVTLERLESGTGHREIAIKHDDLSATTYGGNKIRKLEYMLQRAIEKGAKRVATFGAVGSNHAVATALCAKDAGIDCTCFLAHQSQKPGLDRALRLHQQLGTELVYLGGERGQRVQTLREYLVGRNTWVIPIGGSSWLGSVGFVNAGLELAAQISAGDIPCPERIYVAFGTMGTGVGLALGLALANLDIETHAVRVTETQYASHAGAERLMSKTALLMNAMDPAIPADLAERTRLRCRDEFFAGAYGRSNEATERAIAVARDELGISLESTYTGKAMAALLHDFESVDGPVLFWNTYNSRPLFVDYNVEPDFNIIPREFERYFEQDSRSQA